jgi:hypothetical protein
MGGLSFLRLCYWRRRCSNNCLNCKTSILCQHQCRSSGVAATNVLSANTKRCAWLTLLADERPSQPDDRVQLAALYMLSQETLLGCRGPMQAMTVHFSPDHATLELGLSHTQQHGEAKRSANRSKASYTANSCYV